MFTLTNTEMLGLESGAIVGPMVLRVVQALIALVSNEIQKE
jgi:hypothetical protein